jgi:Acyl-CoA dehydrogenase, N-terminal domain.
MELSFSAEELTFRDEIRAFIRDNLPREVQQRMIEGREIAKQDIVDWQAKLNTKGWATPHWPKEVGGARIGALCRNSS